MVFRVFIASKTGSTRFDKCLDSALLFILKLPLLLLIAMAMFLVSCCISIAEAISERDWPRETFRFVLYSGMCVLMCLY